MWKDIALEIQQNAADTKNISSQIEGKAPSKIEGEQRECPNSVKLSTLGSSAKQKHFENFVTCFEIFRVFVSSSQMQHLSMHQVNFP